MKRFLLFFLLLSFTYFTQAQVIGINTVFPKIRPEVAPSVPFVATAIKPLQKFSSSELKVFTKIGNTLFTDIKYKSRIEYNNDCLISECVFSNGGGVDSTKQQYYYDAHKRLIQIKGEYFRNGKSESPYNIKSTYKTTSTNVDTVKYYFKSLFLASGFNIISHSGDLITKNELYILDSTFSPPKYLISDSLIWTYDNNRRIVSYLEMKVNETNFLLNGKLQLDTTVFIKYKYNSDGLLIDRENYIPNSIVKINKISFSIIKNGNLITEITSITNNYNQLHPDTIKDVYSYNNQVVTAVNSFLNGSKIATSTSLPSYDADGNFVSQEDISRNLAGEMTKRTRNTYTLDENTFTKGILKEVLIDSTWEITSIETLMPSPNCTSISPTQEKLTTKTKVYPNPAQSEVFVQFDEITSGKISLLDITGKVIKSNQIKDMTTTVLDLKNCITGLYFLKIVTVKGSQVVKFMIQP